MSQAKLNKFVFDKKIQNNTSSQRILFSAAKKNDNLA